MQKIIIILIAVPETSFDQMEEEPEPKPKAEPPAEPEPATCIVQGKKRKRKVLNKSVLGEDGYLCKYLFFKLLFF